MDITKGRDPPGKKQSVTSGETNKAAKVSATVAPFSVSLPAKPSEHKVHEVHAVGPLVQGGDDDLDAFGKTVAQGFNANLKFCTLECPTCHTGPKAGALKYALVIRITAAGLPVRIRIAGGKEVPDAYIVKLDQLHHEKYVLLGSSLKSTVSLHFADFNNVINHCF